jgi:hypothetical protein
VFNVSLNAFVIITVGSGGIYALTLADLVTWSAASLVLAAPVPDATAGSTNGPHRLSVLCEVPRRRHVAPLHVSPGVHDRGVTMKG